MNTLTKNNLFVSLCASSLAFQTYILYGLPVNFYVIYMVFFSTLFIYSFHRLEKIRSGVIKAKRQNENNQQKTLKKWSLISLLVLSPLIFVFSWIYILVFLILGLLTIYYSLGLFKTAKGRNPLRKVPYLKLFWIGGMWTIMTVAVPLMEESFSRAYVLLVFERLLFVLAITIPFDIRDIKTDSREGLKTFPIAFGMQGAKRISMALLVLFGVLVGYAWYVDLHNKVQMIFLLVSMLISILLIKNIREGRSETYFSIGIEGLSLIQSVLIALSIFIEY